jgi:hypothetical protein
MNTKRFGFFADLNRFCIIWRKNLLCLKEVQKVFGKERRVIRRINPPSLGVLPSMQVGELAQDMKRPKEKLVWHKNCSL